MSSTYPEGPWAVRRSRLYANESLISRQQDAKWLFSLRFNEDELRGVVEQEEIARLIAAAPELLEALREIASSHQGRQGDMARAAIAKATGTKEG